jgi:hypothetical protein
MANLFPLVKRFQDAKVSNSSALLREECCIHGRCFREGTIFFILGWREVNDRPHLVISKGSWEGMVDYQEFVPLLENL